MALKPVSLDDKFDIGQGRIFVTGFQALVRLCLMQKERDRRAGLHTAGFVTGYRGSPLGGLDQQFLRAARQLAAADIKFQAGINEDLAATALWGSQQAELRGEGKFDGVFGLWYGKGPGVDRTGDVFRHANFAGKSMHETVESTAVIDGSLERVNIVTPQDFVMPEGGLNIRLRDTILGQEARLHDYKRDAMLAFVRANKLNKYITSGGRKP